MAKTTFTIDIEVIARMRDLDEFRKYAPEELMRLIRIGMAILKENEPNLNDYLSSESHYHLPPNQKEAMTAAAQYIIMKSIKPK